MFIHRIGFKIILVVGIVTFVALFFTGWFYSQYQEKSIIEHNNTNLTRLTESVIQGLQTIMLVGYADVAQIYADRLKEVSDVKDFRILRTDGLEAFRDNKTIDNVNTRRGEEAFIPRDEEKHLPVLLSKNPELLKTQASKTVVRYQETSSDGENFVTYLAPIFNGERCHKCHGGDHDIRGILKFTTSLDPVEKDIRETRIISFIIMGTALFIIIVIVGFVLFRTVVKPIAKVSQAMDDAATGDLNQVVPVYSSDEIGHMAGSFNIMSGKLLRTYEGLQNEQDKLATIILSAREGIIVTNRQNEVALVNPAAEILLGKTFQQIQEQGFQQIIDDQALLNNWLKKSDLESKSEIVEYNNFFLSIYVSIIHAANGEFIGSAALIRDVTEEKRLEEKLRILSSTDALTGLYNRRFLDQTIEHQVSRHKRYKSPLSILMFDVDHFKKFNDTYGHNQGDRVLQAIADEMISSLRNIDFSCRYGGEEFIGILTDTNQSGAEIVAERLRANIEAMEVDGLKVTISIGVASIPPLTIENAAQLVQEVDKALYLAKDNGRNRVQVAK